MSYGVDNQLLNAGHFDTPSARHECSNGPLSRHLNGCRATLGPHSLLATPARAPAPPAPVAASIARHDGSAEAAGGGVAQVDESRESVGGVDGAGPWSLVVARRPSGRWPGSRAVQIARG